MPQKRFNAKFESEVYSDRGVVQTEFFRVKRICNYTLKSITIDADWWSLKCGKQQTLNFKDPAEINLCAIFSVSQNKIRILMLKLPVLLQSKMLMTLANQPSASSTNRKQAVFRCTRRPWGFPSLIKAVLFFLQWGVCSWELFSVYQVLDSQVYADQKAISLRLYIGSSPLIKHHSSITILWLHVKQ